MSLTKNQKLSFWKEVEYFTRPTSLRMSGHLLSSDDAARVANAYVLWALVIQDLLGDARIHSDRALRTWVLTLFRQDVSIVINTTKLMLTCIRNWSPFMGEQGLDSFKHYLISNGITIGDLILSPFWSSLYKFSVSFLGFKELNSCLSFIGRLTLSDVPWIEESAIEKYKTFEIGLKTQSYDSLLIKELRTIFLSRVKHFRIDGFSPSHGNGATLETRRGCGVADKFVNYQETFATHQLSLMVGWDHPLIRSHPISTNDLRTRVIFVPKGIDKKRVISTEPISHQYYQHLIADGFDAMFTHDDHWHVDLHRQSFNRDLALEGSGHNRFATIDITDASDSVTHSLVHGIMHGTLPYSLMERCRTRSGILPNGDIIPLEKYAPMGSAVCFPLECIIFSLIIQLACKICNVYPDFRVYGDDMIVPDSIYEVVIMLLNRLHFNINIDKTFPPYSIFTESCGIECYNSVDVSPIRIPRSYDSNYYHDLGTSPGRVYGIISFANNLYDAKCFIARSYVINKLLAVLPDVAFSTNKLRGLYSPTPTNFHLKTRWNKQLQRTEYLCSCLAVTIDDADEFASYICMLEKLNTSARTSLSYPSDLVEIMVGSSHLRLKKRWRSQWDLDSVVIESL